ncbi:hypothetical protein BDK51DRAFT_52121 [Blyttiomyces helicus]|uniref:UBA domain-containing protein n=1 Tax=Blyttiomyces helicus TaxID=388810 RepID=A0A4P9VZ16_9FUNG|nr:hypothetical protein BDK51DRAFT_52121 [Blyttiomyces helicus]|eukprot:RKO85049.1 hypothetical protein BDK51DRAFT_52121 [Blyttiomyces helicus]
MLHDDPSPPPDSAAAAPAPDKILAQLLGMGFDLLPAQSAIAAGYATVDAAAEWICDNKDTFNSEPASRNPPLVLSHPATFPPSSPAAAAPSPVATPARPSHPTASTNVSRSAQFVPRKNHICVARIRNAPRRSFFISINPQPHAVTSRYKESRDDHVKKAKRVLEQIKEDRERSKDRRRMADTPAVDATTPVSVPTPVIPVLATTPEATVQFSFLLLLGALSVWSYGEARLPKRVALKGYL